MNETTTTERDPAFVEIRENPAREAAREMVIGTGGVLLKDWAQLVDFAKYMSTSAHAVAKPLRCNVGICIAIIDIATRWNFSAWQLARHCYVVNDVLAFDSQTIHAVIEKFAPLKYRLRPKFEGEGNTRTCTIVGHFKGEVDALEYITPPLGKITPKNSPLWVSDPDQQLFYFATRRWARRYCPDVLLGAYSVDDMEDSPPLAPHLGFDNAKDVSPKLADRLRGQDGEGFSAVTIQSIDTAIEAATNQEPATPDQPTGQAHDTDTPSTKRPSPGHAGRADAPAE